MAAESSFSADLRTAMEAAGLNLKQASELFEVPYRTIQDWRAGRRVPPIIVQKAILQKLDEASST